MLTNLPKWYRIASVDAVTEEILEKRSTAIETIVGANEIDFLLNCVRLYLDKPIKSIEFPISFFKAFNSTDAMFLEDASLLEKRVLAGVVIFEYVNRDLEHSLTVASALQTAVFGIDQKSIINLDIVSAVIEYINKESVLVRQSETPVLALPKYPVLPAEPQTLETLTAHIKGMAGYIKAIGTNIEKERSANSNKLDLLMEESNIHWWLFRAFSSSRSIPVIQLQPNEAPYVLAVELSELIIKLPIPVNSKAFLSNLLSSVPNLPEEISIKEAVEVFVDTMKNHFDEIEIESFGNLSPLYFAFSKYLDAGKEAWESVFEKQTCLKGDFKSSPLEISLQFLSETLLYHL